VYLLRIFDYVAGLTYLSLVLVYRPIQVYV